MTANITQAINVQTLTVGPDVSLNQFLCVNYLQNDSSFDHLSSRLFKLEEIVF